MLRGLEGEEPPCCSAGRRPRTEGGGGPFGGGLFRKAFAEAKLFGRRVRLAFGGTALACAAFAAVIPGADKSATEEDELICPVLLLLLLSVAADGGFSNTERRDATSPGRRRISAGACGTVRLGS